MKKLLTLLMTLFLCGIFAFAAFGEEEGTQIKIIKHFDADTTSSFYEYRDKIVEVNFRFNLNGAEDVRLKWSIGESESMGIYAWVTKNDEETLIDSADRYNLYIGAVGDYYFNSNSAYFFGDFTSLKRINGLENVKTDLIVNAEGIFSGCKSLQSLDLSSWNTSNMVIMSRLFYGCENLKELDLSSFDTRSLTTMHYMFGECKRLRTIYVSDKWQLREDVTGHYVFVNCYEIDGQISYDEYKLSSIYATTAGYLTKKNGSTTPDVPVTPPDIDLAKTIKSYGVASNEDFNKYKDDIVSVTFLNSIDSLSIAGSVEKWDNIAAKKDGDLQAWIKINTPGKYDLYIAGDGGVNANPDSSYMFYEYKNLKSVNGLQNLNMENATDMKYMFYKCEELSGIDLSSLNTKNVKDMSYMFGFCYKLKAADLSGLDTSKVQNMANIFYHCSSLEEVDFSGLDLRGLATAPVLFVDCPVKKITAEGIILGDKSVNIFKSSYNGAVTVEEISFKNADTSAVTNMSRMFEDFDRLTVLDLTSFDLTKVKDMSYMFYDCDSLETVYFGTVNAVNTEDMSYMFANCEKLRTADFSGVTTGSIKNMGHMFYNCQSLDKLNFGKFSTSLLQNLEQTFRNCLSLTRIYVGEKWSIKAVSAGSNTFKGCNKLVGSVAYAVVGDDTYKGATLNGYFTPVDETVIIPPLDEVPGIGEEPEDPDADLNIFQRIAKWFRELIRKLFDKLGL